MHNRLHRYAQRIISPLHFDFHRGSHFRQQRRGPCPATLIRVSKADDLVQFLALRRNQVDDAGHGIILIRLQENLGRLSRPHQRDIAFVHIRPHPHAIHVADRHQDRSGEVRRPGNNDFTHFDIAVDNGPVNRCADLCAFEVLLAVAADGETLGEFVLAHRQRRLHLLQHRLHVAQFRLR